MDHSEITRQLSHATGDTIAAIATPPGRGGVGIVRVSGPLAYEVALQLSCKTSLSPRIAQCTSLFDPDHQLIDEGLLIYFKAPHSFTGEEVIEFQVHGAPVVLDHLLQACVALGVRLAQPGEFSLRAFLNDKIDLTQAEAIADLIQANTQTAARMALRSLQGAFSKKINALDEQLIDLRLFVEASIDFPEEALDFINKGMVVSKLEHIMKALDAIRATASQGVMIREGLSVVIAGRPNVGKSTLMNALACRDVAIVTPIAGTTRDVMRELVLLDDLPVHLIDTAGLRETDDPVEQEGVKRAWQEISRADCVLMVNDAMHPTTPLYELSRAVLAHLPPEVPMITLFNKIDALHSPATRQDKTIYLSAQSGEGLPLLIACIKEVVGLSSSTEGQFLARRRHIQALDLAKEHIMTGLHQLKVHRALELLAEDLRLAHQSLNDITGVFTSDDLLGKIFSSFCIGK